jgi:hypothetical protein
LPTYILESFNFLPLGGLATTWTEGLSATTWAFVKIKPELSIKDPEPMPPFPLEVTIRKTLSAYWE